LLSKYQGDEASYRKVMESSGQILSHLFGVDMKGIVGGGGNNDTGAVKNNQDLLDKAFALGKELAG
jgi:hypothetical protein